MPKMFLNGTAMSGEKDHAAIGEAKFLGSFRTAPRYRFFSVRDEFPGLLLVSAHGASIEGELYDIEDEVLRKELLPHEPRELDFSTVELSEGQIVQGMRLVPERLRNGDKIVDIADFGSWRAYKAHLEANARIDEVLGRR